MECMHGRMVRLHLIRYHKNNCLGLQQKRNDKKLIDKTPQEIGNELTLLYNEDKLIKEVLDEEFEKGRKWIEDSFDFNLVTQDVSVFETNIRFVGG